MQDKYDINKAIGEIKPLSYTGIDGITVDNDLQTVGLSTDTQNKLTNLQIQADNNTLQNSVQDNEITALQNGKQEKLTAGTNITIDSNNVISASGGSSGDVVTLTGTQTITGTKSFDKDVKLTCEKVDMSSDDEGSAIKKSSNKGYLGLYGGTFYGKGGSILLFGQSTDATDFNGSAQIIASTDTEACTLELYPNQQLLWNSNQLGNARGMAAVYSDATVYKKGDLCTYLGDVYQCKADMTAAESWTASHWTRTNIDNILKDKQDVIVFPSDFTTNITVGNLTSGTNLKNMTLSNILKTMLYKEPPLSGVFTTTTASTTITLPSSGSTTPFVGGTSITWGDGETTDLTSVTYPITHTYTNTGTYNFEVSGDITSIGNGAFNGCTSLTTITIPNSVTSIGGQAFRDCTSLTSITIPNSVISIGSGAFYNCTSLASITIPDSVTIIGDGAFWDCTSLTSITIPDSVTSIGNYTFAGCESITSITIPDSVTSIGNQAFRDCTSLTSITIPNSVKTIGNYAFNYCTSLTTINYNGTTAQWSTITLGTSWHSDVPATTVHCTDGDVSI